MATVQNAGVNVLPLPLATVIFHFHKSDAYEPEYYHRFGAKPKNLRSRSTAYRVRRTTERASTTWCCLPEAEVERRRREYPGVKVEPIKFSSAELGAESWKFLLGAFGNDALRQASSLSCADTGMV